VRGIVLITTGVPEQTFAMINVKTHLDGRMIPNATMTDFLEAVFSTDMKDADFGVGMGVTDRVSSMIRKHISFPLCIKSPFLGSSTSQQESFFYW
jgi:hypothetical protein